MPDRSGSVEGNLFRSHSTAPVTNIYFTWPNHKSSFRAFQSPRPQSRLAAATSTAINLRWNGAASAAAIRCSASDAFRPGSHCYGCGPRRPQLQSSRPIETKPVPQCFQARQLRSKKSARRNRSHIADRGVPATPVHKVGDLSPGSGHWMP